MLPLTLVSLALVVLSPQDRVLIKGRKPLRGSVPYQDDDIVRFNPYFSTHPQMVWNTEEFPASSLKEVTRDWPAVEEFRVRLTEVASVDELLELAEFARENKLPDESKLALEAAMRLDPADDRPRKAYGRRDADNFVARDPGANPQLGIALDGLLIIEDVLEARAEAERIRKEFRLEQKAEYFARVHRSAQLPKGLQEQKPVELRGDVVKGSYALFVPPDYDPLTPTPVLIGLHGGGAGGKDGDRVVGCGEDAMHFYRRHADRRGIIVACPTALRAPWRDRANEPLIRAVVDELKMLFNVDLGRIYLTGHSMGGFGAWHFGPLFCEEWAAFAPMSGGGSRRVNFGRLEKTRTFVYLYHGSNDTVVRPGDTQAAAQRLLKGGFDFVYTEIPDSGHGLPTTVAVEMFDFFQRKRLYVGKKTSSRPRSSFEAKESREESKFFGALIPKRGSAARGPSSAALVKTLAEGGGAGERAADQLIEQADRKVAPDLEKVLKSKKSTADARALAARVLGAIQSERSLKLLGKAARETDLRVFHAAVEALSKLTAADAGVEILRGIDSMSEYFQTRLQGGSRMSFSDWEAVLPEIDHAIQCVAECAVEGVAEALASSVVRRVLLPRINVPVSTGGRQDPERTRGPLLQTLADVLQEAGGEDAARALSQLEQRYADTEHHAVLQRALERIESDSATGASAPIR